MARFPQIILCRTQVLYTECMEQMYLHLPQYWVISRKYSAILRILHTITLKPIELWYFTYCKCGTITSDTQN
jgi:hypothetical protein